MGRRLGKVDRFATTAVASRRGLVGVPSSINVALEPFILRLGKRTVRD
jgi:hypothetical protein